MCVGVPGRILEADEGDFRMGRVAFGDAVKDVNLSLVPGARVGDYVLVNMGTAVTVMDEAEAFEVMDLLEQVAAAQGGPD